MSRVLLIGGPSDGQEIDGPTDVRGWVGILLPLYAGVLKARSARWPAVRTGV
jgi:hypothetical protein